MFRDFAGLVLALAYAAGRAYNTIPQDVQNLSNRSFNRFDL